MRKKIVTHPDNLKFVQAHFEKIDAKETEEVGGFTHFINPFRTEIVTNPHMEKEKVRWRCIQDKICKYYDEKFDGVPSALSIKLGLVIREATPLFYEVEEPRITFFDTKWLNPSKSILTNYV